MPKLNLEPIQWLGILFVILGGMAILSAFPFAPLAIVQVGPISFHGVSQISITRMAVGAVLVVLGLKIYKND